MDNIFSKPSNFAPVSCLNLLNIFDSSFEYLNNKKLFFTLFGKIPSRSSFNSTDITKVEAWMDEHLKDEILVKHFHEDHGKSSVLYLNYVLYVFPNEIVVTLNPNSAEILHSPAGIETVQFLSDNFKRFIVKKKKNNHIHLIVPHKNSIDTTPLPLKNPKINLSLNYNNDLIIFHTMLLRKIKEKGKAGLFLLHGKPGTGKSTYIRYLIHRLNTKVIFMPPKMAGNLDAPEFTEFLVENGKCVLVIEDAEELIKSRETSYSNLSMLLNLTDGLLGEALGIKVIATFNTHISNLDKALLRKGRLKGMYEFKELAEDKCRTLAASLGVTFTIAKPLTLAEIYNADTADFPYKPAITTIGYRSN